MESKRERKREYRKKFYDLNELVVIARLILFINDEPTMENNHGKSIMRKYIETVSN